MGGQFLVVTGWICLVTATALSQEAGNTAPSLKLPAGNGSWVIRVATSGGFSGTGNGNVAISSKGEIVCAAQKASCPRTFEVQPIQRLIEKFAGLDPASLLSNPVPAPGICNDCITRRVTIVWRDPVGVEHFHSASWDDLTAGMVPKQIIEIYDAVMSLRK
jgi:hypothetical protein